MAEKSGNIKCRIGAASSDGKVVNQHFGRADRFLIADVYENNEFSVVEDRRVKPVCESGNHDDNRLNENAEIFSDCDYIIVSRIGQGALNALESRGISVYEIPDFIDTAINRLLSYIEIQNMLSFDKQEREEIKSE